MRTRGFAVSAVEKQLFKLQALSKEVMETRPNPNPSEPTNPLLGANQEECGDLFSPKQPRNPSPAYCRATAPERPKKMVQRKYEAR